MSRNTSSMAKAVGSTLAHVQHGMDKITAWAFDKMQKAGDAKEPKKEKGKPTTAAGRAGAAGRSLLRFVGQAGKEFYSSYDKLKQKESGQTKKKKS